MAIAIGGTCVGYFDSDPICEVDENRKLASKRHEPIYTNILHKNLALRKKLIINFDSYGDGRPRGWQSEAQLRNLVNEGIAEILHVGSVYGLNHNNLRQLVRLTFDNEADELYSIHQYAHFARIFIAEVNNRFDIGLGNFNGLRREYYDYICRNVIGFKYLDIHLQKDFETPARVNANMPILKNIANVYGKIMSVTEAFPVTVNLWTQTGYNLLLHQLNKSIEYGCPEFCCFIKYDQPNRNYDNLAFISHGRVHPNWNEFKSIIKANAPTFNLIEEFEGMKLKLLKVGSQGLQVKWLQKILMLEYGFENTYQDPFDGKFGNKTNEQVKEYQMAQGIKVDGLVGPDSTAELILAVDQKPAEDRKFSSDYWMKMLQVYMAYEN